MTNAEIVKLERELDHLNSVGFIHNGVAFKAVRNGYYHKAGGDCQRGAHLYLNQHNKVTYGVTVVDYEARTEHVSDVSNHETCFQRIDKTTHKLKEYLQ